MLLNVTLCRPISVLVVTLVVKGKVEIKDKSNLEPSVVDSSVVVGVELNSVK
jgi:hypothetical protein